MRSYFSLNHVLRGVEIPKSREECGSARRIVLVTMILVFLDNYIVTFMFIAGGPTYKLQFSVASVILLWYVQVGAKKRSPASSARTANVPYTVLYLLYDHIPIVLIPQSPYI